MATMPLGPVIVEAVRGPLRTVDTRGLCLKPGGRRQPVAKASRHRPRAITRGHQHRVLAMCLAGHTWSDLSTTCCDALPL
jgi:hypothetical protein